MLKIKLTNYYSDCGAWVHAYIDKDSGLIVLEAMKLSGRIIKHHFQPGEILDVVKMVCAIVKGHGKDKRDMAKTTQTTVNAGTHARPYTVSVYATGGKIQISSWDNNDDSIHEGGIDLLVVEPVDLVEALKCLNDRINA